MNNNQLIQQARELFTRTIETKQRLLADDKQLAILATMAQEIAVAIAKGGKLMLCGNGGSCADAQHLAAELLVRLRPHVNRDGIAALALTTDMSSITACGNDYSYEVFFERMVQALGSTDDILLGISTSGNSRNVIMAMEMARKKGIRSLGFLGGDGGPMLEVCDLAFIVPSNETGRIQESHITAGHTLMEMVEDLLLANGTVQNMAE